MQKVLRWLCTALIGTATLATLMLMVLSQPSVAQPSYVWPHSLEMDSGCFTYPGYRGWPTRSQELACLTTAERESLLAKKPLPGALEKLRAADELYRKERAAYDEANARYRAEKSAPLETARNRIARWFGS